ncbi:hypothetical protein Tco_0801720 [Tanacetum coccineum]|uniref:Uncharacterized protein n=1 Tax=Tanacetum coccineum TaxID=301880 RepID=A0ABQ5A0Z4_9ASTR
MIHRAITYIKSTSVFDASNNRVDDDEFELELELELEWEWEETKDTRALRRFRRVLSGSSSGGFYWLAEPMVTPVPG